MKNQTIFESALALLDQSIESEYTTDLAERAPYIIANFCSEVLELDRVARSILGKPSAAAFSDIFLELDEDFPLLERFASVAARYLAAMLVIDDDPELSDKLYATYCDGISFIKDSLPSVIENIKNKYL